MIRNHWKPLKVMDTKSETIEKPLIAMVRPPSLQNYWNVQWFQKKTQWTWQGSFQKTIFSQENGTILWSQLQSWLGSFVMKSKFWIYIAVVNQTCLIPLNLDAFIQQPRLFLNHSFIHSKFAFCHELILCTFCVMGHPNRQKISKPSLTIAHNMF